MSPVMMAWKAALPDLANLAWPVCCRCQWRLNRSSASSGGLIVQGRPKSSHPQSPVCHLILVALTVVIRAKSRGGPREGRGGARLAKREPTMLCFTSPDEIMRASGISFNMSPCRDFPPVWEIAGHDHFLARYDVACSKSKRTCTRGIRTL